VELNNTLNQLEDLNHFLITHTPLKEENLEAATSTLVKPSLPSPDTMQSMENLDYTLNCPLLLEVPSQFVLMPQAGNHTLEEFSLNAETMLTIASKRLDMPTAENQVLTGSSETHGEPAGEKMVSFTLKSDKISAQLETMPPLLLLDKLKFCSQ